MSDIKTEIIESFFKIDWPNYKAIINKIDERNELISYNIISISTYSGHLENYHSDVWGFLLDKMAAHKKSNTFLSIFIYFLLENNVITADVVAALQQAKVYREKGRIDILIVNEEKKVCVIIENKINNATDQLNQLERYKQKAIDNKWQITAMLYISLNGGSLTTIEDEKIRVHPIAAVNNYNNCLLNGWLLPAKASIPLNTETGNEDARSFIHQYCMLLEKLSAKKINNMSIKFLYQLVNAKENFETALLIEKELDKIKLFREELFSTNMEKYFGKKDYFFPAFKKKSYYSEYINHMIFERFNYDKTTFQLDIVHYKNRTKFIFYNPDKKYNGDESLKLLTSIIGHHEYASDYNNPQHLFYTIQWNSEFANLIELDEKVKNHGIALFTAFNNFNSE